MKTRSKEINNSALGNTENVFIKLDPISDVEDNVINDDHDNNGNLSPGTLPPFPGETDRFTYVKIDQIAQKEHYFNNMKTRSKEINNSALGNTKSVFIKLEPISDEEDNVINDDHDNNGNLSPGTLPPFPGETDRFTYVKIVPKRAAADVHNEESPADEDDVEFVYEDIDEADECLNFGSVHRKRKADDTHKSSNVYVQQIGARKQLITSAKLFKNQKTFKCDVCKKMFVRSSNLFKHIKSKHASHEYEEPIDSTSAAVYHSSDDSSSTCSSSSGGSDCEAPVPVDDFYGEIDNNLIEEEHKSLGNLENCNLLVHSEPTTIYEETNVVAWTTDTQLLNCEICSTSFSKLNILMAHKATIHSIHTCEVCAEQFTDLSLLEQHKKTHSDVLKPFKCDVCDKPFSCLKFLKSHKLIHLNDGNQFQCNECDKSYCEISRLRQHYAIKHPSVQFTCDICGKIFGRLYMLKNHMISHSSEPSVHKCTVCDKVFKYLRTLKEHLPIHSNVSHKCDICDKSYSSKTRLRQHTRTAHISSFSCDECGLLYRSSKCLQAHKRKHAGIKPFKCAVCPKAFSCQSNLKSHELSHSDKKKYNCDICFKSYKHSSGLKTHKRIHSGEKPYKCDICNKSFVQQNSFNFHKAMHSGVKPFVCNVCGKRFTVASSLRTHELVHLVSDRRFKSATHERKTNSKIFQCEICFQTFVHSSNYYVHKRTHSGHRPFKCDVCDKTFHINTNLKVHKLLHTGEKPFKCNVCEKKFRQKGGLTIHLYRVHNQIRDAASTILPIKN